MFQLGAEEVYICRLIGVIIDYLKELNFHELREFLTIFRKLVPAKIIGDSVTRKIHEN